MKQKEELKSNVRHKFFIISIIIVLIIPFFFDFFTTFNRIGASYSQIEIVNDELFNAKYHTEVNKDKKEIEWTIQLSNKSTEEAIKAQLRLTAASGIVNITGKDVTGFDKVESNQKVEYVATHFEKKQNSEITKEFKIVTSYEEGVENQQLEFQLGYFREGEENTFYTAATKNLSLSLSALDLSSLTQETPVVNAQMKVWDKDAKDQEGDWVLYDSQKHILDENTSVRLDYDWDMNKVIDPNNNTTFRSLFEQAINNQDNNGKELSFTFSFDFDNKIAVAEDIDGKKEPLKDENNEYGYFYITKGQNGAPHTWTVTLNDEAIRAENVKGQMYLETKVTMSEENGQKLEIFKGEDRDNVTIDITQKGSGYTLNKEVAKDANDKEIIKQVTTEKDGTKITTSYITWQVIVEPSKTGDVYNTLNDFTLKDEDITTDEISNLGSDHGFTFAFLNTTAKSLETATGMDYAGKFFTIEAYDEKGGKELWLPQKYNETDYGKYNEADYTNVITGAFSTGFTRGGRSITVNFDYEKVSCDKKIVFTFTTKTTDLHGSKLTNKVSTTTSNYGDLDAHADITIYKDQLYKTGTNLGLFDNGNAKVRWTVVHHRDTNQEQILTDEILSGKFMTDKKLEVYDESYRSNNEALKKSLPYTLTIDGISVHSDDNPVVKIKVNNGGSLTDKAQIKFEYPQGTPKGRYTFVYTSEHEPGTEAINTIKNDDGNSSSATVDTNNLAIEKKGGFSGSDIYREEQILYWQITAKTNSSSDKIVITDISPYHDMWYYYNQAEPNVWPTTEGAQRDAVRKRGLIVMVETSPEKWEVVPQSDYKVGLNQFSNDTERYAKEWGAEKRGLRVSFNTSLYNGKRVRLYLATKYGGEGTKPTAGISNSVKNIVGIRQGELTEATDGTIWLSSHRHVAHNTSKSGKLNAKDNEITWEIRANDRFYPIQAGDILEDLLDYKAENGAALTDTTKDYQRVKKLPVFYKMIYDLDNTNWNPDVKEILTILKEGTDYEFLSDENRVIKGEEWLKTEAKGFKIRFIKDVGNYAIRAAFTSEYALNGQGESISGSDNQKYTFNNAIQLILQGNEYQNSGSVSLTMKSGELFKLGKKADETDPIEIWWELVANGGAAHLHNVEIMDTPKGAQSVDLNSVVLYAAEAVQDKENNITFKAIGEPLPFETLVPASSGFKLTLQEINSPIIVKYKTIVDEKLLNATNDAKIKWEKHEYVPYSNTVYVRESVTGGNGSGNYYNINLHKRLGENNKYTDLNDIEFRLEKYSSAQNTFEKVAESITGKQVSAGYIYFNKLNSGYYRLIEKSSDEVPGLKLMEPFIFHLSSNGSVTPQLYDEHEKTFTKKSEETKGIMYESSGLAVNFTIDNRYKPFKLSFIKKDKDEQTPLTGAEFSLEDSQGKKLNLVKKDATFTAENLTAGSYTLTETQVPQFFERLFNHVKILIDEQGNVKIAADTKEGVEAIKITKTNGEEDNLIEFSVLNSKKILGVLPTTGGIGTQIFIISALLLLLAASMLAGVYWYRNKKIS
ncbi:MSCRAMM family protein [Enterococcus dispar]|uniref:Prealbumin-like fold domain-containing protein n=1 Tax=Enterococcus dispar ATCC 51266 TaxID=1139219 RepID=S0KIX6_9ENTE|nr:SpaA isopeptide-forming pilin-related protein [Enterococcus dispar]EOT40078.1 hypothetical protein OMK_01930 [Enterococcus dispar ATCC 51266]EOW86639.1 hypothetical protein I569_01974 [Enterococcus dispar ATCC 51266]OJG39392.1 hypothetical protein RV01_GL001339 [Enterococcus dispar]